MIGLLRASVMGGGTWELPGTVSLSLSNKLHAPFMSTPWLGIWPGCLGNMVHPATDLEASLEEPPA